MHSILDENLTQWRSEIEEKKIMKIYRHFKVQLCSSRVLIIKICMEVKC